MRNAKSIIAIALLLCSIQTFAQVKRVRVEGRCEISRFITLDQAEKIALQEAMVNALDKAGVPVSVWSAFGSVTKGDGNKFFEIYSEMTSNQVEGLINVHTKIFSKEIKDKREYAVAKIEADVQVGQKPDKSYAIKIEGISSIYKNNDDFSFDLTVYGYDSYVKIFWFDDDKGDLFYPNYAIENEDILFKKGKTVKFPQEYEMNIQKNNPMKDYEIIHIIAVATKKPIPFLGNEVSYQSIMKWIYDIPVEERCQIKYSTVVKD